MNVAWRFEKSELNEEREREKRRKENSSLSKLTHFVCFIQLECCRLNTIISARPFNYIISMQISLMMVFCRSLFSVRWAGITSDNHFEMLPSLGLCVQAIKVCFLMTPNLNDMINLHRNI